MSVPGEFPPMDENAANAHSKKSQLGANWKQNETHDLPKNRLWIALIGLMGCLFLATIHQTIFALPAIIGDLGDGQNYSWVSSAYLLAAAVSTINRWLSDLTG